MPQSTEEVFSHHMQMFGAGDVEGCLTDYTEDSYMISPMGVVKGIAALREMFTQLFKEFGGPGSIFNLDQQVIEGDLVYLLWSAETPANKYSFGTDTLVIRNGKIAAQTYAGVMTPKS